MKSNKTRFSKFIVLGVAAFAITIGLLPDATAGGGIGSQCGGLQGAACEGDLFCDYPVEAKCGAGDQTGTCAAKPKMCTKIYMPVCGCDGKTYSNDCVRKGAGVSKLHDGACSGQAH